MSEKTHQLLIPADSGNYGRITVGEGAKEYIALKFDNFDAIYYFKNKHARKIGWYMLKQGFINPLRNLFKK
jgi:hypothetical protein